MLKKFAILILLLFFLSSCSSTSSNVELGENFNISPISREDGSGTRKSFIEKVGLIDKKKNGGYEDRTTDKSIIVNSTNGVIKTVAMDKTAIGYVSNQAIIGESVKVVSIDKIFPTKDAILSGMYELQRPFNLVYDKSKMSEIAKDFLEFLKSEEVESILKKEGLVFKPNNKSYKRKNLKGQVKITGSSSLGRIVEDISRKYEKLNKEVEVEVSYNESLTGVKNIKDGVVDFAMVSSNLEEKSLESYKFATDAIAIIVNKNNKLINNLSIKDLRSIYMAEISNTGELNNEKN